MGKTSNLMKVLRIRNEVSFLTDVFYGILMQQGFTFDPDTHALYEDVIASELATSHGYTQGGVLLENPTVTEDSGDDCAYVEWDDLIFQANIEGSVGPTDGVIIYRSTTEYDEYEGDLNVVVGYSALSQVYTILAGYQLKLVGPKYKVIDAS